MWDIIPSLKEGNLHLRQDGQTLEVIVIHGLDLAQKKKLYNHLYNLVCGT